MIKIKSYGSGSKGNLYLVSTTNNKTNIILECGVKMSFINDMLNDNNLEYKDISAVFTSHLHNDHSNSIKYLQEYDLHCYCTEETKEKYLLEEELYTKLENNKLYKFNNDLQIISFSVNHGECECYGFIFRDRECFKLFITDFMSMKTNLSKYPFLEIWVECNYIEDLRTAKEINSKQYDYQGKYIRQLGTHQELNNLINILKSNLFDLSNCDKINLIHISKDVGNRDIMQKRIEEELGIETCCLLSNGKFYYRKGE